MSNNPEQPEVQDGPSFLDMDPSDFAETDNEEMELAPEAEAEEAGEEEPEEEIEAAAEEVEEEPAPSKTPRAQKRIQQLAEQKNELQSQNEELLALVEQLKKSNELNAKNQERQDRYWQAQEQQSQNLTRRQIMQQYGLNPDDPRDAIAYEQMEYKTQLEQQLQQVQAQLQQQQEAVQIQQFNNALDGALSKRLSDFDVSEDAIQNIRDVAYDMAALRGMTAGEAAEAAVSKLQSVLPKKAKKRSKAAKADPSAKLVAKTGNRTKTRNGQSDEAPSDFLELVNSGKFFL